MVGDRAEAVVLEHLRSTLPEEVAATVGWTAAEGRRPGWDIEYVGEDGGLVGVEVKGTVGSSFTAVELTANEWRAAQAMGARYRLALVARCAGPSPLIEFVDDPAGRAESGAVEVGPASWTVRFAR